MSTTPEGKVKKKIRDILKRHKVFAYSPQAGPYGMAGIPDFLCCVNGFFVAIEAKAYGNTPKPVQIKVMNDIVGAKGIAVVITERDYDVLERIILDASSQ